MRKELKQLLKNIDNKDVDWNSIFKVTDQFVDIISNNTIPFYTPFGSFYMTYLPRRFKACIYLLYTEKDFYWMIESIKLDKKGKPIQISAKRMIKIIAWLMKYQCLQFRDLDPFEEFALAPKPPKVFAILEPPEGWDKIYKELLEDNFKADDDITDLDAFMKENGYED